MAHPAASDERAAFAERIRLQLRSRYRGVDVAVEPERFALRLRGEGIDVTLPLSPLHHACLRDPDRTPALIADFVRRTENRLVPSAQAPPFALPRLLWCVRTSGYLRDLTRSRELLSRPLAADLVAFVAETLPGSIMRGIPRPEWEGAGLDDDAIRTAAAANTAARFAGTVQRIRDTERIPNDGWSITGDLLFQGSLLVDPDFLRALAERVGGDVLLAHPDRSHVLALPASSPGAAGFRLRVNRTFREALNPISSAILVTDGEEVRDARAAVRERRGGLLGWLRD